MDIAAVVRMIRRLWVVILALTLLGGATGAVIALVTPASYQSEARIYVKFQPTPGSTAADLVQANNFTIQKTYSYVEIVKTPRVLEPVIAELGLDLDWRELASDVQASVVTNSVVLKISASAGNPDDAAVLADQIVTVFSDAVVNDLESPVGGGAGPVQVEVLQPATAPDSPASPSLPLYIALGLFGGLVVGLSVATIAGLADRRVHSRGQLEDILERPALGSIPEEKRAGGLATIDAPTSAVAESYRSVRTELLLRTADVGPRVFTVTSSLPDEGKTTFTANLAVALADGGFTVAMVDADLRAGVLADRIGASPAPGMADVLEGRAELLDVIQPTDVARLSVVAGGTVDRNPSDLLTSPALGPMLGELARTYDVVLVDTPPTLPVADAVILTGATAGAILVVGAGSVDVSELRASLESLDTAEQPIIGAVIVGVPASGADSDPRTYAYRYAAARGGGRKASA